MEESIRASIAFFVAGNSFSPFAISKSQKLNFEGVFSRLSDFLVSPAA